MDATALRQEAAARLETEASKTSSGLLEIARRMESIANDARRLASDPRVIPTNKISSVLGSLFLTLAYADIDGTIRAAGAAADAAGQESAAIKWAEVESETVQSGLSEPSYMRFVGDALWRSIDPADLRDAADQYCDSIDTFLDSADYSWTQIADDACLFETHESCAKYLVRRDMQQGVYVVYKMQPREEPEAPADQQARPAVLEHVAGAKVWDTRSARPINLKYAANMFSQENKADGRGSSVDTDQWLPLGEDVALFERANTSRKYIIFGVNISDVACDYYVYEANQG